MPDSPQTRRSFLKTTVLTAGYVGAMGFTARSYGRIPGANSRVNVGVVGFSDRFKTTLLPAFLDHAKTMNFDLVALSDLWNLRRDEGRETITKTIGHDIHVYRNNEELYDREKPLDAVIISTADFQHALHTIEAVQAGCDVYVEKPFAETMADNNAALDAVHAAKRIVQVGSQRRSGENYHAAADFIQSGQFGPIVNVELTWNVNQPDRWRRPALVAQLKESDVDWKRYLMNRPMVPWDARKYIEYRLFWPYSSGIPGQWMCHQIDTVNWFAKLDYPRSVAVNGGIYAWKDGRTNADTLAAVFDYGPADDPTEGFQVIFASRMNNSAGDTREIYYSTGGTIDLATGMISPKGGIDDAVAKKWGFTSHLLPEKALSEIKTAASAAANMGSDPMVSAHMANWMECIRSRKQPNAPVEAGYNHSIAGIMANAAYRTGARTRFDPKTRQVMAGGTTFDLETA